MTRHNRSHGHPLHPALAPDVLTLSCLWIQLGQDESEVDSVHLSLTIIQFKAHVILISNTHSQQAHIRKSGVVGWCEGVVYLTSLGRPTDNGLQLGKACYLVAGKGRGGMFLFLLFLHFHSCSSFFTVPLFHLFYYLFYLFSPFLWETTQNDPQGLTCR